MSIYETVLFDYQKIAAKRIQQERSVLLADQPGLGKTLEVLGALELDGLFDTISNILILTPIINAQTTWRDTIERFVRPRYEWIELLDVSKGTATQKAKVMSNIRNRVNIVLANHNALDMTSKGVRVHGIVELNYDAVIIDESHMVLPIKDPRKATNFWKGLSIIKFADDAIRIAVSGTPDRGKLENRYGTWKFLHPDKVKGKWTWLEENFYVVEQKVSRTRTIKTTAGIKDEAKWLATDRAWMVRRTKQEVLPQLPPKRYVDVEVELGNSQRAQYFNQQTLSTEKIYNAKIEERDNSEAMVFALRARQLATCSWSSDSEHPVPIVGAESAKLDWLMAWLDERGFVESDSFADNSAQVVIVSQFSKVLHWLREELANHGIISLVLDGSVSDNRRTSIQQEFQAGNVRIVLLSGSMGVGINLDRADDLIMLDSPYDPDRIEQIEDRVHRASSNHHVTIWNVIAVDTIDQAIMEKVSSRYQTTRTLMDGSRGVDFARKVMEVL